MDDVLLAINMARFLKITKFGMVNLFGSGGSHFVCDELVFDVPWY